MKKEITITYINLPEFPHVYSIRIENKKYINKDFADNMEDIKIYRL